MWILDMIDEMTESQSCVLLCFNSLVYGLALLQLPPPPVIIYPLLCTMR